MTHDTLAPANNPHTEKCKNVQAVGVKPLYFWGKAVSFKEN